MAATLISVQVRISFAFMSDVQVSHAFLNTFQFGVHDVARVAETTAADQEVVKRGTQRSAVHGLLVGRYLDQLRVRQFGHRQDGVAAQVVADEGNTRLPSRQFMLIDSRTNPTLGAGLVREVRS